MAKILGDFDPYDALIAMDLKQMHMNNMLNEHSKQLALLNKQIKELRSEHMLMRHHLEQILKHLEDLNK